MLINEGESCEFFEKIMKLEVWIIDSNEILLTSLPISLNKIITINTNSSYKVEEYSYQKEIEILYPRRLIKFIVNKFGNKTPQEMRIECKNKIKILELDPKKEDDVYESCETKVCVCQNNEYLLYYEIEGIETKIELKCEEAFDEDKINIYFINIELNSTCKLISKTNSLASSSSSQNLQRNKNKSHFGDENHKCKKLKEKEKIEESTKNIGRILESPWDDVLEISRFHQTDQGQINPNTPTTKTSTPTFSNSPTESQKREMLPPFHPSSSRTNNNLAQLQLNKQEQWQRFLRQQSFQDSSISPTGQQNQTKQFIRNPSFQSSSSHSQNILSPTGNQLQNRQNIFNRQHSFQESSQTISPTQEQQINEQLFGSPSSQNISSLQIPNITSLNQQLASENTNTESLFQQIDQQHSPQSNHHNQQQIPISISNPQNIFSNQQTHNNYSNDYFGRLPLESPKTSNQINNFQNEHQIQTPQQNKIPQNISISSSTSKSSSSGQNTSTDDDKNKNEKIAEIVYNLQKTIEKMRYQRSQNNELYKYLLDLKEKSLQQKEVPEAINNQNIINENLNIEQNKELLQSQNELTGNDEEQYLHLLQHFNEPTLNNQSINNLFLDNNMEELQQQNINVGEHQIQQIPDHQINNQQNIGEMLGTSSEPVMTNFNEQTQQKEKQTRKRKTKNLKDI
uniref:Uncharacterized protein n=1 Tax=Meloidogyne hapla TaxID=6305 RepID=A0A1I8BDN1_MELHA